MTPECNLPNNENQWENIPLSTRDIGEILFEVLENKDLDIMRSWNIRNRISESNINVLEHSAVQSLMISELESNWIPQEDIDFILCEFNLRLRELESQSFLELYEQVQENFPWDIRVSDIYNLQRNPLHRNMMTDAEFWKAWRTYEKIFWYERRILRSELSLYASLQDVKENEIKYVSERWDTLKQGIPEILNSNDVFVSLLPLLRWQQDINTFIERYQAFRIYGFHIRDYEWPQYFTLLENDEIYERFSSESYISIASSLWEDLFLFDDIRTLWVTRFFWEDSGYHHIVQFFDGLSITPQQYVTLYSLLDIPISSRWLERIPWVISEFSQEDFQVFLEGIQWLLEEFPVFQTHRKNELLLWDLLESYLWDAMSFEPLRELNQALMVMWVEWFDYRSEYWSWKILLLEIFSLFWVSPSEMNFEFGGWWLRWDLSLKNEAGALTDMSAPREIIEREDFVKYIWMLQNVYSDIDLRIESAAIIELFQYLQDNNLGVEILASEDFLNVASYLWENFVFTKVSWLRNIPSVEVAFPNIAALWEILSIYQDFPMSEITALVDVLRDQESTIYANDFATLLLLVNNETYRNIFLSWEIPEPPVREWVTRTVFWRVNDLERNLERARNDGDTERINEIQIQIQDFLTWYSERPDFQTLPYMNRMRIYILTQAIKNSDFQTLLWEITTNDLNDNTTEYGWIISYRDWDILPINLPSLSDDDGSYHGYYNHDFHGGITSFHLHALEIDSSEYAGPSWYWSWSWDFWRASAVNDSDVVFTTLWYPIDEYGNPDTSRIRLNADYYFIDKRDPENHIQVVYDMGIISVPLWELE